jgi:hypothetical protein
MKREFNSDIIKILYKMLNASVLIFFFFSFIFLFFIFVEDPELRGSADDILNTPVVRQIIFNKGIKIPSSLHLDKDFKKEITSNNMESSSSYLCKYEVFFLTL